MNELSAGQKIRAEIVLGTKLSQHSWQAAYPKYLLVTVIAIVTLYAKYVSRYKIYKYI